MGLYEDPSWVENETLTASNVRSHDVYTKVEQKCYIISHTCGFCSKMCDFSSRDQYKSDR